MNGYCVANIMQTNMMQQHSMEHTSKEHSSMQKNIMKKNGSVRRLMRMSLRLAAAGAVLHSTEGSIFEPCRVFVEGVRLHGGVNHQSDQNDSIPRRGMVQKSYGEQFACRRAKILGMHVFGDSARSLEAGRVSTKSVLEADTEPNASKVNGSFLSVRRESEPAEEATPAPWDIAHPDFAPLGDAKVDIVFARLDDRVAAADRAMANIDEGVEQVLEEIYEVERQGKQGYGKVIAALQEVYDLSHAEVDKQDHLAYNTPVFSPLFFKTHTSGLTSGHPQATVQLSENEVKRMNGFSQRSAKRMKRVRDSLDELANESVFSLEADGESRANSREAMVAVGSGAFERELETLLEVIVTAMDANDDLREYIRSHDWDPLPQIEAALQAKKELYEDVSKALAFDLSHEELIASLRTVYRSSESALRKEEDILYSPLDGSSGWSLSGPRPGWTSAVDASTVHLSQDNADEMQELCVRSYRGMSLVRDSMAGLLMVNVRSVFDALERDEAVDSDQIEKIRLRISQSFADGKLASLSLSYLESDLDDREDTKRSFLEEAKKQAGLVEKQAELPSSIVTVAPPGTTTSVERELKTLLYMIFTARDSNSDFRRYMASHGWTPGKDEEE